MNYNNRRITSFGDLSAANLSRTLSSPVAESTHIEGSGNNRSGLFASPIKVVGTSVKRKPTSPLLNSRTSFKSSGSLSSVGYGRIDSQVYTDAQSRGLVNRLVKYHDKTQSPLNRSQSMTSIYNKPGQFPVVHLKKTEIKYSPRRNNSITSVRIAPPEKSVFQANTRSNILRAGSLLIPAEPHLKQSHSAPPENEIDAENRVIAPSAELDAAPTKSVLDALKEISRKRINNEELDADRIKKQCKELSEVDSGSVGGMKRARELASSISPPLKGSGDQQLQKKRLCCKNNDILSSLSSSLVMSTPKRVEQIRAKPARLNVDQTFTTPMPSSMSPNSTATVATERRFENREPVKVTRVESAPLPQIVRNISEAIPPIRPKPTQQKITLFNKKYDETVVRPAASDTEEQEDDEELGSRISFIKPKDKSPVLNSSKANLKQVEKSKLSMILSCLSEGFDDDEDEVDTPKITLKAAPIFSKDTVDAVPPKTEDKKVETVVAKPSGIAALINEPIKDSGLQMIVPTASSVPKSTGSFSFGTPAKTDSNATFSFIAPTSSSTTMVESKPTDKPTGGFTLGSTSSSIPKTDAPPAYSFPSATVTTPAPAPSSSGFTLASTPLSVDSTPKVTTTTTANLISFSPASVSKTEVPKSGFSLLPPITTNASSGNPQTSQVTSQSITPSFGSGSGFSAFKSPSSNASSTVVTTGATNIPSFGSTSVPSNGITTNSSSSGGFSFGTSEKKNTGLSAAIATTTASSTTSAFTFGTTTSSAPAVSTSMSTPAFGTSSAPKFSFGSTTTPVTTTASFSSTNTTTAVPAFGGSFTTTATPTTAPPPFGSTPTAPVTTTSIFGVGTTNKPAFGQPTAVTSSFSFGGAVSQQPATTTTASGSSSSGAFSFGAVVSTSAPSAPTTSSSIFGSNGSTGTTTSGFGAAPSFGNQPVSAFASASSANPSAFGTSGSGSASIAPAASGFGVTPVFGSAPSSLGAPVNSGSIFGASSASASPFGGNNSSSAPTGNLFGIAASNNNSTSANATPSPFSFGTSSAVPVSTNASATSSAPAPNKPFSFGGIASNNATANPATNSAISFGFSATTNSSAPAPAASAFSFTSNSNKNNNSEAPPSAFGSTGNASFSFNANTSSTNSNTATVKPFSFGTPSQPTAAPVAGAGIFGSAATAAPSAFNFSAGSNAASSGGPVAFPFTGANAAPAAASPFGIPNGAGAPMFSIGTGGGANVPPGRRPIRTATRRNK